MIICLGATPTMQRSMAFQRFTVDEVNRAAAVEETASGKSINVARVLHTLGQEVLAIGFLGGFRGQLVRKELETWGVRHDFLEVSRQTRLCTTINDRATGQTTELVEESPPVDPADYDKLLAKLKIHLPAARMLVMSGTLTPGAPADFYADAAAIAAARDVPVILDAKGEPLNRALAHKPLAVKPNVSELAATVGMMIDSDEALMAAMRQLLAGGPHWVVITRGAAPAILSDGHGFWRIVSPRIDVVNPIGSGDSFAAGLAAGILSGAAMPHACRLAAACGAANALTPTPGDVNPQDVRRLESTVRIEQIA